VPITSDTTIVCTKLQEPSYNILVSLGGNHSGACETSISETQDTIFTLVDLVRRVPSDLGPAVNLCTMIPTLNVAVWIHLTSETIKSFPTVATKSKGKMRSVYDYCAFIATICGTAKYQVDYSRALGSSSSTSVLPPTL
jgi:hypothetical protein